VNRRSLTLPLAVLASLAILLLPLVARADEAGSDVGQFQRFADQGLVVAFAGSFFFGFLSSLTPCVFPMVPITVSVFGATESTTRTRAALLSLTFVLGIATLFTTLGVASAVTGAMMGAALANKWVVIFLAVVFAVLAASMFGAFEIALPASVSNRLSTVGGIGYKGAFVIGLVMGLIAMPCTGPFVIGLAIWTATKSVVIGATMFFAFSLGLGLIFFVVGTFAVALPKAGAWMMGIKWVSGVVLSYMAIAYLRDRFPAVAAFVSANTLYALIGSVILLVGAGLGLVHISAERRKSPIAHLSKPLKLASILPAVVGAFMFVSWFEAADVFASLGLGKKTDKVVATADAAPIVWKTTEPGGLAEAAAQKKPVLIDFGAEWCHACKDLEKKTFPDARVRKEASRFVSIHIDATDDEDKQIQELQKKYKVAGLPTVVLLDSDGHEKARFSEFVEPDKFVTALQSVN
jgi:thiol:disulfide interchange protein DsbD